jgi:exopolyphosphatase / guanosine-5'-triphosphate,3'-diphosphate pyrophosphatase
MPVFAAVDIGSNSVRLKIARLVRHRLQVIEEDREVTRLGEGVFANGQLTPQAVARTVKVLQRFHKAAQKRGATLVRAVATSALRDARNAATFLEWVRSATGWKVEVISGLEEARLIHLGVLSSQRTGKLPVLMVDLGGGSCELTISERGHIRHTASLPLGAVRLTSEFLKHDPPRKTELERLHSFIAKELRRVSKRQLMGRVRTTIATSGTAAALAMVCKRAAKSGYQGMVPARSALKMSRKLTKLSVNQRGRLPGIGPRRAEIIVAGAMVFAELIRSCGLQGFRYSPLGLRDGLLAQMAADYDARTKSHRQIESDRWDSLLGAGRHYQVDHNFARKVRDLALNLFQQLRSVHNLPAHYGEWLSAAAMLHEVGGYLNRYGWHRHSYYVVANSEILGYTAYERRAIAAIARYLGSTRPAVTDKPIKLLAAEDRIATSKAVVLLRLARALNQSRRGVVTSVTAVAAGKTTNLVIRTKARAAADLELWALEKECAYFREVFKRELEARVS